ncbi:MAG: hypothetical protein ACFFBE_03220 [Promethearchaeota archaeon]
MGILYESFGSFHTGVSSYRMLISKRSRGTISLTDDNLSFESQKDKVPFRLKLSEIQDFFMKNQFSIPVVEIVTLHGNTYNLYSLRRSKKHYHSSLEITEDLFRQLTRLILNKDQIILFDAIVAFYPSSLRNFNFKESSLQGHIFLTENYILFKSFQTGKINRIEILQIKHILMEIVDTITYVTFETLDGAIFSLLPLKASWGRFTKDKVKTEKLYDILNQTMMYKQSEQLGAEELTSLSKNETICKFCGNIINSEVSLCPFCGNENRK